MLPSLQLLEKVSKEIMSVPNRRKESKRRIHYGLFLLGYKAGLRISEAVNFDLANRTKKGLYRIQKPKGKKERLVYVPKKVIKELRKRNWKPNSTNRFNFYHFLKKIKQELNISGSVELTPHTLRHAFATYQAESGLSLPILQKLLGYSSIRTTALYWQNIYQEPNNDIGPILAGKKWLENKEPPEKPSTENFAPPNKITTDYLFPQAPESTKPIFIDQKLVIPNKNPTHENNSLSVPKIFKKTPQILTNKVSPKNQKEFSLNSVSKNSDQLKITQPLALIANNEEKPTKKEAILLAKIEHLEQQLKQTATERNNLKQLVQREKSRADNYERQLKIIVKTLKQWQKINYYQQLEQEQKAQIEQPPPFKVKK